MNEFILQRRFRQTRPIVATDDEMNVETPAPVAISSNNGYTTETIKNGTYRVGRSRSRDKKTATSKKLADQGGIPARKPRNKRAATQLTTESQHNFIQSVLHAEPEKKQDGIQTKGKYNFEYFVAKPIEEASLDSSSASSSEDEAAVRQMSQAANFRMQSKGVTDNGRINLKLPAERPVPATPVEINEIKYSLPAWFRDVENVKVAEIVDFLKKEKARVDARRANKSFQFLTLVAGFMSRRVEDLIDDEYKKLFETVDQRIAISLDKLAASMPTTPIASPITVTLPPILPPRNPSPVILQRTPIPPTSNPVLDALIKEQNLSPGSSVTLENNQPVRMTPEQFMEYIEERGDRNQHIDMTADEMMQTMARMFDTYYQPDVIREQLLDIIAERMGKYNLTRPIRTEMLKEMRTAIDDFYSEKAEEEEHDEDILQEQKPKRRPRERDPETTEAFPTDMEEEPQSLRPRPPIYGRRINPTILSEGAMRVQSGAPPIQVAAAPTGKDILLNYLAEKELVLQYFKEYYDRKSFADLSVQIALNTDSVQIADPVYANTRYALAEIKRRFNQLYMTEFEHYLQEDLVMTNFALLTATLMTQSNNKQTTRDQRVINIKAVPLQHNDIMNFFQDCTFDGLKVTYIPLERSSYYNNFSSAQFLYPYSRQTTYPGSRLALPPRFEFK